jgi:hypothetical protein
MVLWGRFSPFLGIMVANPTVLWGQAAVLWGQAVVVWWQTRGSMVETRGIMGKADVDFLDLTSKLNNKLKI